MLDLPHAKRLPEGLVQVGLRKEPRSRGDPAGMKSANAVSLLRFPITQSLVIS